MVWGKNSFGNIFIYLNKGHISQNKVRPINGIIVKIVFTFKFGICCFNFWFNSRIKCFTGCIGDSIDSLLGEACCS